MRFTGLTKFKVDSKQVLWIESIDSSVNSYQKIKEDLLKWKIPTVNVVSKRRPEHKMLVASDYYDIDKNKTHLMKYLSKKRNAKTRFELYEHCCKLLTYNNLRFNENKMKIGLDLGCGVIKSNTLLYKYLDRHYLYKTLWYGIDLSKFMINFNPGFDDKNDIHIPFDRILCDTRHMYTFNANICFDFCISVSMLQWYSHSKLELNFIKLNLSNLFEFLFKFLNPEYGTAIFQFYPDSVKSVINIVDVLCNEINLKRFNFILYKACPHDETSKKVFLYLTRKRAA